MKEDIEKTRIVLYIKGERFISFLVPDINGQGLPELKKELCLYLMQKDINGTEHYNVLGIFRNKKGSKNERSRYCKRNV